RTNGPHTIAPDGRSLVFEEIWPGRGRDLMRFSFDSHEVVPLLQTPFEEVGAQISPDGRWLAYATDATGRMEVHVRPYPNVDAGHWQVSFEGGREPLWSKGGAELVYRTPDGAVMSVAVDAAAAAWTPARPKLAVAGGHFVGRNFTTYGVAANGQRFLMLKDDPHDNVDAAQPRVVVVQHWNEELNAKTRPRH